jgi:hypothetical protein
MMNREQIQFHMQNCTFQRNKASESSALFFYSYKEYAKSTVTIIHSTFDSNVAVKREVKYLFICCYCVLLLLLLIMNITLSHHCGNRFYLSCTWDFGNKGRLS